MPEVSPSSPVSASSPALHSVPLHAATANRDVTQPETHIGHRNVVWGWTFMAMGVITGSILSAWSFGGPFGAPSGFHDYGDLPRRMVRLAHIALFMLPIINIQIGKDLDRIDVPERWKQIASWGGVISIISVPGGLALGALVTLNLKYLSAPGVTGLLVALLIMGFGTLRRERRHKNVT